MTFKVGDIVEIIDDLTLNNPRFDCLITGKQHTVLSIADKKASIRLKPHNDCAGHKDGCGSWFPSRFKLIPSGQLPIPPNPTQSWKIDSLK